MDYYKIALLLARFLSILYIVFGLSLIVGSFALAVLSATVLRFLEPLLDATPNMMISYGVVYEVGGWVLLAMSRLIAKWASRI